MGVFDYLNNKNISIQLIVPTYLVAMSARHYATSIYIKNRGPGGKEWDASCPPEAWRNAKEGNLPPQVYDQYARAYGAQNNGFVNLPLFATAMIAGTVARLPARTLNYAGLLYLASRIGYTLAYINITTPTKAVWRSALHYLGVADIMLVIMAAGRALA